MNKILRKLKSPVSIATLAALILFVLKNYGLLNFIGLTEESYNQLVTLIVSCLAAFGILNNPDDRSQF
jgi:uncharacterized membrane protein